MSDNQEKNNLLARWLNNDLNEEELENLKNEPNLDELRAVVDDISTWSLPDVDIEKRLQEAKNTKKNEEKQPITRTMYPVLRYAAILALIAVAFFVIRPMLSPSLISIETGLAEQITHELPDGSLVTLGPQSKLEYSKKDWLEARNTELVGQGYFDVEKGESSFTVTTNEGKVTVLGTEFDVYESGNSLTVDCFEGRVQVNAGALSEILNMGQGVRFDGENLSRVTVQATRPDWLSGRSTFDDAPLTNVIRELKRYYDVEIEVPAQHRASAYNGSFVHNDLSSALRSIFSPLEIPYTLSEGKVVFD